MKVIVLLVSFASFVVCGVIHDGQHHQATSYQSIHMEHFHAVPTYGKKDDVHYLEHPISEGKTESKVEVFHGSKHEPGYAVAAIHSDIHGHQGGHNFAAGGHSYEHGEHQVEDHGDQKDYAPAQYHGGYSEEVQDGGHEEADGHSQEEGGHYQYIQEAAHDGDDNASYYHEGGHDGEDAHGSYEQAHEESAEHY